MKILTKENLFLYIKNSKSVSAIIKSIKNNKDLYNMLIKRTSYLNENCTIAERCYHIKHDIFNLVLCPICNKTPLLFTGKHRYNKICTNKQCRIEYLNKNKNVEIEKERVEKIKKTWKNKSKEDIIKIQEKIQSTILEKYGEKFYAKTDVFKEFMLKNYGYVSPFELPETHEKSKNTLMERYSVNQNFKIESVIKKREQTFMDKYGFNIPTKNDDIKSKIKLTNNKKYGFNSPMQNSDILNKSKETLMQNYSVTTPLNNDVILKRFKETMTKKYGVEYWIQNSDNFNNFKIKYNYKQYNLNGKIIKIQGYEDYALENIILKKYSVDDIFYNTKDIIELIGKIDYYYNGSIHYYYPDFYIKSLNLIIEVKSDYTYKKNLELNEIKRLACLNKNINFEYIIITKSNYLNWLKTQK